MFEIFREDLKRYGDSPREKLRALLFSPPLWAIAGYRFARWIETSRIPRVGRKAANFLAAVVELLVGITTNIELPARATIGPGLFIAHTGYIVLGPGVVLGRHCTLTQGVTIGHAGGGGKATLDSPVIGDRVYLGPGAAVVGPITVGNDALIGIHAVVIHPVPERAVVVGNPAHVISFKGSFDLICYPESETDPDRLASLAQVEKKDELPESAVKESALEKTA